MTVQQRTLAARPTLYRGVRMRSRLEAGFAQMLDRHRVQWSYEPECFADETGQYMPDFLVESMWVNLTTEPVRVSRLYLDVKPRLSGRPNYWDEQCRRGESIIRSSEADARLVVAYGWRGQEYDWEFSAPTIGAHPLRGEFYRCCPNCGPWLGELVCPETGGVFCAAGHDLTIHADADVLLVHMIDHPGTCPDTASRWVHGLCTQPDSAGNYYRADDLRRPF